MTPILSILTPAVPSRLDQLKKLADEINRQAGYYVEHLMFLDNKKMTVGEKRDALLRAARGEYVAFVDDDDWIAPNYVDKIVEASHTQPDVITFRQHATVNGESAVIEFRLGNPNEPFKVGIVKRNAWHICAWRRALAIQSKFPPINYGEDWAFAAMLCAKGKYCSEIHIPEILHFYRHDSQKTEAPPP